LSGCPSNQGNPSPTLFFGRERPRRYPPFHSNE